MQATSDITSKNTEYPVNLTYPLLYPAQRNDEARTADWCAALRDATSSVEGIDPQSEEADQAQLSSEELLFDRYGFASLSPSTSPKSLFSHSLSPTLVLQTLTGAVKKATPLIPPLPNQKNLDSLRPSHSPCPPLKLVS